jgi:integration host factor subunit alpha
MGMQPKGEGTLARAGLAEALRCRIGVSSQDANALVESILKTMCNALARGETVKISNFGTFAIRDKVARVGRNPKTLVEVPITARRVMTFRASDTLRQRINGC